MSMERVNRILSDPRFCELVERIATPERTRIYCRHDLAHFLAVARIAAIEALDSGYALNRELIYAAALLHDLGRAEDAESHAEAGARIARTLLPDCGFDAAETRLIADAIAAHGAQKAVQEAVQDVVQEQPNYEEQSENSEIFDKSARKSAQLSLSALLSRADRLSRECWHCTARDTCYWTIKNDLVEY